MITGSMYILTVMVKSILLLMSGDIQWEEIAEGLRLDVKVVKALDEKQKIVVY